MLKKALIGLAVVVAGFVAVVAMQPATMHIERATNIAASADVVQAQLVDFHAWGAWSPWDKIDPGMKRTFEGPASGPGAKYSWDSSNDQVGAGSMTIASATSTSVVVDLEFTRPFADKNQVTFTLTPDGAGTKVVWAMDGAQSFPEKAFGLFMDMDAMLGGDFDKGLGDLKRAAEGAAAKAAAEAEAKAEAEKAAAAAAAAAAATTTTTPN